MACDEVVRVQVVGSEHRALFFPVSRPVDRAQPYLPYTGSPLPTLFGSTLFKLSLLPSTETFHCSFRAIDLLRTAHLHSCGSDSAYQRASALDPWGSARALREVELGNCKMYILEDR